MSFVPDILVVSPDEQTTHLLVEVGASSDGAREKALKHQMIRMRAPTGLVVTPQWITVYRDTFKSYSEDSIAQVGLVSTSEVEPLQAFSSGARAAGPAFEDAVQEWLVQLKYRLREGYLRGSDLKPVFREHVLPALRSGQVRAAGPRVLRTAAHH